MKDEINGFIGKWGEIIFQLWKNKEKTCIEYWRLSLLIHINIYAEIKDWGQYLNHFWGRV